MRFLTAIALLALAVLFAVQPARAQDDVWIKRALKQQRVDEARWNYYARWEDDDDWRRYRPRVVVKKDYELQWAQERLGELDYTVEADGYMGPQTRTALMRFQKDYDLPVTGTLDTRTKEALHEAVRPQSGKRSLAWAMRPEICEIRDGRQCTCEPIVVFTGEHSLIDCKKEGKRRWRGYVRAVLGELWIDWKSATSRDIQCWYSATGERATDANQERCMVQARACMSVGLPAISDDDDGEVDVSSSKKGR